MKQYDTSCLFALFVLFLYRGQLMFQLLHISDIHLTPFAPPRLWQLCNKRITGWLNWKLNRSHALGGEILALMRQDWQAQGADHLAISGDLVNLSLQDEFIQMRQWLAGLGKPDDISLVLGNHDAYVPGAWGEACRIFAPWITDDAPEVGNHHFPYFRQRGDLAIIGVNCAVATMPFSARGVFDKSQAARLATILQQAGEKNLFRVVMLHHPPLHQATSHFKSLKGIELFQQVIATHGAELILHGHTHKPSLNFIAGLAEQVPVVGVASISQSFCSHKPAANYNLFQIERREKGWRCLLIRRAIVNGQNDIAETMRQELYP